MKKLAAISLITLSIMTLSLPVGLIAQEQEATRLENAREAIDQRSTDTERAEARQQRIYDAKKQRVEAACGKIQERVKQHQANISSYRESHFTRYDPFTDKVDDVVARFGGAGYDVSKIQSNMVELDGLVGQAKTDFANYEVLIQEVIQTDCAEADGNEMYQLVQDMKAAHPIAESSVETVKQYITTSVKESLNELKLQLESSQEGEE